MNELYNFSKHLAEESGKIIRSYFRTSINVETKHDESPVTIADKKAEEKIREMIMKEFPRHGILGEEFGEYNPDAEYKWILDPIDGTKSFICGAVTFGTLIALLHYGQPVIGVIYQPVLNEFLFGNNETALLNGTPTTISDCSTLSSSVLLTTDHLLIEKYKNIKNFNELIHQVKLYRHWGDCYGYYLLATGFANIMIDPIMSIWDTMALIPIIKGAKGIITDYEGNEVLTSNSVVAASPGVHKKVIEILNK